jgi:peptide/nickel transport system permease protein
MNEKVTIFILLFIVLFTFFGEYIYEVSPYDLNPLHILQAPSLAHFFGTDRLGRDVFARLIEGGKVSLIIGFLSASITSLIGLFIGINSGYFKGNIDKAIVIVIDLFLTFPTFFLLLALVSYIDASMMVIVIVLSITGWMSIARLIRSESFAIGHKPYIKILKLAGVSNTKIIFKYFAPLLAPIFLVSFTFGVGGAILGESGLSFLGLGINPPMMSLGTILSDGKDVMDTAPWISFFAGLFIFLVTYCLVQISNYIQHKSNNKDIQSF